MRERRPLQLLLTVLVVGAGVGFVSALRRIHWMTFARALARVSPLPFAVALGISTLQVFAQLARFVVVLTRVDRAPLNDLLDATAIGQLLNSVTALRAGDAYKLARLTSDREAPKGRFERLAAALVVERVADLVALLLVEMLGSRSAFVEASAMPARALASRVALAVAVGAVVISPIPIARRAVVRLAREAKNAITSPGFARCLAVAMGTWALDAETLCWTARSAGYPVAFTTAVPCVFLLNVGIALPVTVGSIGLFEASLGFALSRYGIAPEPALAIATLEHVTKLAGLVFCVGILRLGRRSSGP
jgi:uncharacterized membrane protein YbhN (UPF0104 family)